MADTQTPTLGSTVESLAETVVALGTTVGHLGVTVATLPLAALPAPARDNVARAANELVDTFGGLYLRLTKATINGVGAVTVELNKAVEPAIKSATRSLDDAAAAAKK